jgi:Uncharacterised nucleotidyltransferase
MSGAASWKTLVAALGAPELTRRFTLPDWELAIRLGKSSGLLARLALALADAGIDAPEQPQRHLDAARILAEKHVIDVRREVEQLSLTLVPLVGRLILLKGGAYVAADLPPARGRLFGDIDILVPFERIELVEMTLRLHGWRFGDIDPYDDSYYRRWMHQIPPMTHGLRGSTVDVHHAIVPRTARISLAPDRLLETARPLAGHAGVAVLAPPEMVLHSATHLFNEGEFGRALRDLVDLDLLLRHFGGEPAFWTTLLARAEGLDLARPLFYCLRYAHRLLATPIPAEVLSASRRFAPPPALLRVMDFLFERGLRPQHASCRDAGSGLALWLLYVRAHHLRMPAHLLLPHLLRKAVKRRLEEFGIDGKPADAAVP